MRTPVVVIMTKRVGYENNNNSGTKHLEINPLLLHSKIASL